MIFLISSFFIFVFGFSLFADLRTAFDLLDRNRDGLVNGTELQYMLKNMGIEVPDELIDEIIKEASKNGKYPGIKCSQEIPIYWSTVFF